MEIKTKSNLGFDNITILEQLQEIRAIVNDLEDYLVLGHVELVDGQIDIGVDPEYMDIRLGDITIGYIKYNNGKYGLKFENDNDCLFLTQEGLNNFFYNVHLCLEEKERTKERSYEL